MVDAPLELILTDGHEVEVGRHGLPGHPMPGIEILFVPGVGGLQPANADRLHAGRYPNRDVHQCGIGWMIISRIPPRRTLWFSGYGPLTVAGPPGVLILLADVAG